MTGRAAKKNTNDAKAIVEAAGIDIEICNCFEIYASVASLHAAVEVKATSKEKVVKMARLLAKLESDIDAIISGV